MVPTTADKWSVERSEGGHYDGLGRDLPLDYAMGIAEDYARKSGAITLVDPSAGWRTGPATAKQLNALRRWKMYVPPGLSKGAASNLISAVVGDR